MGTRISIHPVNPQTRFLRQAVDVLRDGGLVLYPTDSGYALGCDASSHRGIERLYRVKNPMKKFFMALLFLDFTKASEFAVIDNFAYRTIKAKIPGPYTFILPAEHHIVRKLDVKRPEIGCRWPEHPVLQGLLQELGGPLLNTAAKQEDAQQLTSPDELWKIFHGLVDLMLDVGEVSIQPTNIIKIGNGDLEVIRGEWN
ncbi:MAG TPA: L-threonylcarbamoyladenylate synthase [Fibrobacteraceae bacterium]|nr:L-threonylcarbamoyladenylate synthase [Fibrobacteraceae bacterium]